MLRPRVYQPNSNPQRSRSPGPAATRIVINNTREIAFNLMDYIEAKLNTKLDSLQNLIAKNMRSLKQAEKSFELAESQVFLHGSEKSGRGCITQDIRAFFNIIKAQQADSDAADSEQDCSRKPQTDNLRKSVNLSARSKTPARISKTPNRKPEPPRRSVTPSKAAVKSPLPEHRKQLPTVSAIKQATRTPTSKHLKEEERLPHKTPRDKPPAQDKENNNRMSKDLLEAVQALRQGAEAPAPKKRWEQLYELANKDKSSACPSIASNQADSEPKDERGKDTRPHMLSEVNEEDEDETPRNRGYPHMTKTEKNHTFDSQEHHTLEDFDLSSH